MNVDVLWAQLEGPTLGPDALQQLEQFNSSLKRTSISLQTLNRACAALAGAYEKQGDHCEEVHALVFRTINNLMRRAIMQQLPLDGAAVVLPVLIDHLAPCGFAGQSFAPHDPSSAAGRAAYTLKDLFLEHSSLVGAALSRGLAHPRGDVRCGSLLMFETLSEIPVATEYSSGVSKLCEDEDAQVRQCASQVLRVFQPAQAPSAPRPPRATRIPSAKVPKQTPAARSLSGTLSPSFSQTTQTSQTPQTSQPPKTQPPTQKTPKPPASKNAPAPPRTLIAQIIDDKQYKIQDIKPEQVQSVYEFREICASFAPLFTEKENENNWLPREKAVNRLRALMRGNILQFPGDICAMLKSLKKEVSIAALSLRTTLSMAAIQLIKDASQLLKSYLDPLAEALLQILCKVLASQKKITANAAHIAGCSLALNTSLSMKLLGVVHSTLASQIEFTRECSLKWMHIMFVVHTPEIAQMVASTGSLDMVSGDILRGLQDPKSSVREAARPLFWLFATSWPAKAEQLGQSLDGQQRKALLRLQPPEMFESYNHNFELHVRSQSSAAASATASTASSEPSPPAAPPGPTHVMHPPAQKQTLVAQRHLTDIVRRLSRSLSEEQPLDHPPLKAQPVEIPPHIPEFIDAMPEEEDLHSDMDEEVVEVAAAAPASASAPALVPSAAPTPAPAPLQNAFLSSYLQSAQEAVKELLNDTVDFDPSCFDEVNITDPSQFKEALRAQLEKLPTITISAEDVAAKTAQKLEPKFEQYVTLYPESKDAIESAARLVEAAARGESPEEAMSSAVAELSEQFQDGSQTSSRVNSLAELLDSDDIDTMTMGVNALSFLLRGKRPPSESFPALGTLEVPPPDLIGKALTYLFEQATAQNPQIKEVIERYASSDLVAITLSYVGHALVMYVAVHMLPAEALVLTVQAIQPLLNIGTIIDTLFEIANADDVSEAALLALGGLLTGFDKIPMSPAIRGKAKAALEVIYRLGDLGTDVTAFLADWIGFESDSGSDSDDDSDEEKIAEKHAERFERNMAVKAPASVAEAMMASASKESPSTESPSTESPSKESPSKESPSTANGEDTKGENSNSPSPLPFTAPPISSLHPVSVSFKPNSGTKDVRAPKFQNSSSLDTNLDTSLSQHDTDQIIAAFPENESACFTLFDDICSQLDSGSIDKQGLIQLLTLAYSRDHPSTQLWQQLPSFQERVDRSLLKHLARDLDDASLVLGLKLLAQLLQQRRYTDSVERLKVLECLCAISARNVSVAVQYASLPQARDALLLGDSSSKFIAPLMSIFETSDSLGARRFALGAIRRAIELDPSQSPALLPLARSALADPSSAIRKSAYPILLTIHNQSPEASAAVRRALTQGQLRLFEYYCN